MFLFTYQSQDIHIYIIYNIDIIYIYISTFYIYIYVDIYIYVYLYICISLSIYICIHRYTICFFDHFLPNHPVFLDLTVAHRRSSTYIFTVPYIYIEMCLILTACANIGCAIFVGVVLESFSRVLTVGISPTKSMSTKIREISP